MINYDELDKYFTGICAPVIMNAGGVFLELGEDSSSLFYKIDEDYYADVNNPGIVAQRLGDNSIIRSNYVLFEETIAPVKSRNHLKDNSLLIRRLTFNPAKYKIPKKDSI